MSTELKVFFEIFFNTINEINENKTNIPLRNSELAITRNLYFDILMEITNELRNNQETINESNKFQNNIINGFQRAQNSFTMTPFLTNSINMITRFSTKSKEIISDYLDIILTDSFKINSFNNRTKLYFRKIQLEIFLRWKKTTSNDYNEDIMEFNNLVSKYQVNYSNYIDLYQIISLLRNKNDNILLEIIPFYEKLLKKYEEYDKLKNKLNSKNSKKHESKKHEKEKKVNNPKEKISPSVKNMNKLIDKLFPTSPVKKEFIEQNKLYELNKETNKIFKRKLNTILQLQKMGSYNTGMKVNENPIKTYYDSRYGDTNYIGLGLYNIGSDTKPILVYGNDPRLKWYLLHI